MAGPREIAQQTPGKRKIEEEEDLSARPVKKSRAHRRKSKQPRQQQPPAETLAEDTLHSPSNEIEEDNLPSAELSMVETTKKELDKAPRSFDKDENRLNRKERKAAKKARKAAKMAITKAEDEKTSPRAIITGQEVTHKSQASRLPGNKYGPGQWTLSDVIAGRLIEHDPVFVRSQEGEDFLLASDGREMQLLSLETSLTVRTHSAHPKSNIHTFAVQAGDSNIVHVAYSNGTVANWNWAEDTTSKGFGTQGKVKAMQSLPLGPDKEAETVYLSAIGKTHAVVCGAQQLFSTQENLSDLKVAGSSEYIVALGPSTLVIGSRKDDASAPSFTWTATTLTTPSTCFAIRSFIPPGAGAKRGGRQVSGLQIAIGIANGQIHLYNDVSSLLRGQVLPTPQILHWHRDALSSAAFSTDGNYLLSGGKETVLVLWQLATGKKQFLPHLTSEIERVVVNPEGDRYALQMGDNSIMVLSTSELKPVANFASLQKPATTAREAGLSPAVCLHPHRAHQMLLTVPSTQPKSAKDIATRPFLQTFDLHTSRHISRQALTRNNVTDFNLGPEQTPIAPPDVTSIAISEDGRWLATVDEWMPPASDLDYLASDATGIEAERLNRREVYLKIWGWDDTLALWTLSARMDAPHARPAGENMGAGRVLALVSDPVRNGFATVGEDSTVKVWKPRKRSQFSEHVDWTCRHSVQLPSSKDRADSPIGILQSGSGPSASLAYSSDGSLIAVARSDPDLDFTLGSVQFIDTFNGTIRLSKSGMADGDIVATGFLGRHFIVASTSTAYVWDVVTDSLVYSTKLTKSDPEAARAPLLAVDGEDGSFALAIPGVKRTRFVVYRPNHSHCLYEQKFDTEVEALVTGKGSRGFTLLFANATIRTVSRIGTSRMLDLPGLQPVVPGLLPATAELTETAETAQTKGALTDVAGLHDRHDGKRLVIMGEAEEDDRPVVRPEQLAAVLDSGQSFAMPPVRDMFHAVVGLLGRRSRVLPELEAASS